MSESLVGGIPMDALEVAIRSAASNAWQTMATRDYTEKARYSERLASHLFAHHLLKLRPELEARMWMEYRPWPEEADERIDVWVSNPDLGSDLAIELKVADPTDQASGDRYQVRGEVVADFLKLGSALRWSRLGRAFVMLLGGRHYLTGDTLLCKLASGSIGACVDASISDLIPMRSERYWASLEDWLTPEAEAPSELRIRLVHREQDETTGCWLWEVVLPDGQR